MKAFIALFAAVAVASAEPQFFYNTPVVQSPLAYTPYTYIAKPVEMKKAEEKKPEEEMKEIKPVVYASPLAYNYANTFPYTTYAHPTVYTHPTVYADPAPVYYSKIEAIPKYHAKNGEVEHKVYKRSADAQFIASPYMYNPLFYSAPLIKPVEIKKAEEKKPEEETKEIKPLVYTTPLAYNSFPYTTYAHPSVYAHPTVYADPAPVYYSKIEAIPKYHAKNGEVEHKVYKRSADADPALLYANAFTGYSAAAAAPFYPYAASTYAYSAAFPYNYGFNYAASPYYQWY